MAINEYAIPQDLTVQEQPLSPVELQNRHGLRREMIPDLPKGKYLTVLAVATEQPFTQEEYFSLLNSLKTNHAVLAMQTAFAARIPEAEGHQCDLHMTSHLRLEPITEPTP